MANIFASRDETPSGGFEEFFRSNYASVWRYVARRVPVSRTDDVVSTTFIVAWEKFASVESPSLAWLIRIASFEVANARRKNDRERRRRVASAPLELVAPANDEFDGAAVRTAMATLAESDQEILRMVLWDELPREDIALVLGLTVNAVNVRYHRALQKFQRSMPAYRPLTRVKEDPNE